MTAEGDDDRRSGGHDVDPGRAARAAPPLPDASRHAGAALAAQRRRHQADDDEVDDEGVGGLVVNTGLDGDAASG